jgi:hypothetical protein
MQITIDTNNVTELDAAVLRLVLGTDPAPAASKPAPAKAAPAKAAPAKAAPAKAEPEAAPDEDLLGTDGPTMADAVAAATLLVSSGSAAKVKEALASVDAKRVSEVPEDKIAEFIAALEA